MFLPLLGLLSTFTRQPFNRVGVVYWPRGDDDLARIREMFVAKAAITHESQEEYQSTKEDKSSLQ